MAEIKIAGYFDCKYVQDSKVYEGGGLAPCLRAENHEVKIMEIKNSIDKTRQGLFTYTELSSGGAW